MLQGIIRQMIERLISLEGVLKAAQAEVESLLGEYKPGPVIPADVKDCPVVDKPAIPVHLSIKKKRGREKKKSGRCKQKLSAAEKLEKKRAYQREYMRKRASAGKTVKEPVATGKKGKKKMSKVERKQLLKDCRRVYLRRNSISLPDGYEPCDTVRPDELGLPGIQRREDED